MNYLNISNISNYFQQKFNLKNETDLGNIELFTLRV